MPIIKRQPRLQGTVDRTIAIRAYASASDTLFTSESKPFQYCPAPLRRRPKARFPIHFKQSSVKAFVSPLRGESATTMRIETHRPELEALIRQRMKIGGLHNVEDALQQALETSPVALPDAAISPKRTGADLIAAMQSFPYREIEIAPPRYRMPVRDVTF